MTFRRALDNDTWHWSTRCARWPAGDYVASPTTPYYGVLCGECSSQESTGGVTEPSLLTSRQLERIRDEMRRSGERVRGDLERLESMIILVRAREGTPLDASTPPSKTALVGFVTNPEEPPAAPPPPEAVRTEPPPE